MSLMCDLFGHKKIKGELRRSPHTVYTHYRRVKCERCDIDLGIEVEYHDARTETGLFSGQALL